MRFWSPWLFRLALGTLGAVTIGALHFGPPLLPEFLAALPVWLWLLALAGLATPGPSRCAVTRLRAAADALEAEHQERYGLLDPSDALPGGPAGGAAALRADGIADLAEEPAEHHTPRAKTGLSPPEMAGGLVLGAFASALLWLGCPGRDWARTERRSELRALRQAVMMYTEVHEGYLPPMEDAAATERALVQSGILMGSGYLFQESEDGLPYRPNPRASRRRLTDFRGQEGSVALYRTHQPDASGRRWAVMLSGRLEAIALPRPSARLRASLTAVGGPRGR